MNIDGLVYLLNQAGEALAQANQEIARLNDQLKAERSPSVQLATDS